MVSFEPGDGGIATLYFGRKWSREKLLLTFSNYYSVFAERAGMEIPISYKMGIGSEFMKTMKQILADIKISLPIILEKTTLKDLIAIENEENGAATRAKRYIGNNYSNEVEISEFES